MSKVQKAKESIEKAQAIKGMTDSLVLLFREKIQGDIQNIQQNQSLSQVGKIQEIEQAKKAHGKKLMQEAFRTKQMYHTELKKAYEIADKVAYEPARKPLQMYVDRFESALGALKTELMLTTRPQTAQQKLNDFIANNVKSADDRYFANRLREEFGTIAGNIIAISGPDAAKVRMELGRVFDQLDTKYVSDEVREARELVEHTKSLMENDRLFSFTAQQYVAGNIGNEYAMNLNTPDKYFAKEENAKDKPEDYVESSAVSGDKTVSEVDDRYAEMMRKVKEIQAQLNN